MMRLQVEERYAVNSKGESVPIKAVAWGTEDDVPTHLLLQFTSSHGGDVYKRQQVYQIYILGYSDNDCLCFCYQQGDGEFRSCLLYTSRCV